jgi:LmbE family N-acetylglucosaminyl deacetylase
VSDLRLLITYAHPDDESFGSGGLIARYVREGVDVFYLCATNGDLGTIPAEMNGHYASVADLRLAELAAASEILGLKEVITLGYRDSGMMGSEGNHHPDSLWHQYETQPEVVIRRVVEVIRRVQPQVIVTFNQYGGYGHPDHIAIQRATLKAFHLAGDATYITAQPAYQPQKLYYGSLPATALRFMALLLRLRGHDLRRMGTNKDLDFQAVLDHLEPTHARVNVSDYLEVWDAASACHKSQGGGTGFGRGFPRWLRRRLLGYQQFTRVFPTPQRSRIDEYDLFEGVRRAPQAPAP